jgi:hypothetical protein
MTIREARFRRPPKSAHRASATVSLRGPHPPEIWSGNPHRGLVGRPVLRTVPEHREEDPLDLVIAPVFPIGVLHFPTRTFEQYRHRVEIARDDGYLDRTSDTRGIRDALAEGHLEDVFERIVLDEPAIARGTEEGWLVEQTSFRDYLAACPDPLDDSKAIPLETPEGGGAPGLDDLRDDAMYAISRYLQTQGYRTQQRRNEGAERRRLQRELQRRANALRRRTVKLRRIESSLWWRMRPRLPRALRRRRKWRGG